MDIKRSGSQPSAKGPAEYFTGTVRMEAIATLDTKNSLFFDHRDPNIVKMLGTAKKNT